MKRDCVMYFEYNSSCTVILIIKTDFFLSQNPKPRIFSLIQSRKKQLPAGRKTPVTLLIYSKNSKIPFPSTATIGIKSAFASAAKTVFWTGTTAALTPFNHKRFQTTWTRSSLTVFKLNVSFGFILRNNETGEVQYYYASRNNEQVFEEPFQIHGTKNWIYCTFDARQKLSQIWYWL